MRENEEFQREKERETRRKVIVPNAMSILNSRYYYFRMFMLAIVSYILSQFVVWQGEIQNNKEKKTFNATKQLLSVAGA